MHKGRLLSIHGSADGELSDSQSIQGAALPSSRSLTTGKCTFHFGFGLVMAAAKLHDLPRTYLSRRWRRLRRHFRQETANLGVPCPAMTSHNPIRETSRHRPHENWPDQRASMPQSSKYLTPPAPLPCSSTPFIYAISAEDNNNNMPGLSEVGLEFPQLDYKPLAELSCTGDYVSVRNARSGAVISGPPIPLERDLHFQPKGSLSEYAHAARHHSQIVVVVNLAVPVKA